ncbi:MAG: hypothetical protein ABR543_16370 [Gemmatimonadaceae bacterium]
MMNRHPKSVTVLGMAVLLAAVIGPTAPELAHAQSMPSVSKAKTAANNAVKATNAHTTAMQQDQATPQKKAARPTGAITSKTPPGRASAAGAPSKSPAPAAPASDAAVPRATGATKGAASAGAISVSERGGRSEISLEREVFSYEQQGRRDPFLSLMSSGELRPMISDLKLVGVVYDPTGRSVAILRDLSTKEQYRVKVGQTLGRMRVAQIQPRAITFVLEEFGFSRQEVLALNDSTKERMQ